MKTVTGIILLSSLMINSMEDNKQLSFFPKQKQQPLTFNFENPIVPVKNYLAYDTENNKQLFPLGNTQKKSSLALSHEQKTLKSNFEQLIVPTRKKPTEEMVPVEMIKSLKEDIEIARTASVIAAKEILKLQEKIKRLEMSTLQSTGIHSALSAIILMYITYLICVVHQV